MNMRIMTYRILIRNCWYWMRRQKPNGWEWNGNAISVRDYIEKIRNIKGGNRA